MSNRRDWEPPGWKIRLTLSLWLPLFTRYMGLLGLGYELAIDKLKNPTALVVFGGLAELPDVLGYRTKVARRQIPAEATDPPE